MIMFKRPQVQTDLGGHCDGYKIHAKRLKFVCDILYRLMANGTYV